MTLVYDTGSKLLDHIASERDRIHTAWYAPLLGAPKALPKPLRLAKNKPVSEAEPMMAGSSLDKRLIFSNFFTNESNRLAWVESQRAAYALTPSYNPLYLHGSVGLGKTHLLQAIAHAAGSPTRRVLYLTAERFIYASHLKQRPVDVEMIVIDDIQFLQSHNEFCIIINALIDSKRQVVIAADRLPRDLERLEERTRSRLSGGLCIEISAPDEALRIKILEACISSVGFEVAPEIIAYVAGVIKTNGRDLNGAVNRLIAHATLNGAPHSIETAERAIRDLIRAPEPKKIKIIDIQRVVATHFNVRLDDILSARRTASVVLPRQIAMYLSKALTPRSLPDIGRRFAGRDHTTILHAVRKIAARVAVDKAFADDISMLQRMLTT